MAQSNVLEGNGGGAAQKGAEEGPDAQDEDRCSSLTVTDEGLAAILHQAFERRVFDRDRPVLRTAVPSIGRCPVYARLAG
jgi:hypothetical protein